MTRLWILGASDPEMTAIETLLRDAGETVAYVTAGGSRVHPGNAYRADDIMGGHAWGAVTHLVECGAIPAACVRPDVVVIDHHRPGDPGYGKPPEEFFAASSIGQVFDLLMSANGRVRKPAHMTLADFMSELKRVAAADHCLAAAYAGQCPGVDPEALMRWRAESRAAFQRRPVEAVLADVDAARHRLREAITSAVAYTTADTHPLGAFAHDLADLRGEQIPELPEAAAREGIAFLASVRERDGREKVVLQAAPPDLVARFLAGELVPGLVEMYGDPARGLAGGYIAKGGAA